MTVLFNTKCNQATARCVILIERNSISMAFCKISYEPTQPPPNITANIQVGLKVLSSNSEPGFIFFQVEIKSLSYSRYCMGTCNEQRSLYFRCLTPGQHSSEKNSQR